MAAADPGSTLPADWRQGVFAEIFVRGYKDSNGDGIGDLRGLTQSLDYLRDLGVSGLWLMPITRSQDGDHGYAVADYRSIESAYGSLADLDELLRAGTCARHRRHRRLRDEPQRGAAPRRSSMPTARHGNAYRDWYVFQASQPQGWNIYGGDPWRSGTGGYYFAPFWDQMPDFNLQNAAVVGWHHDNLRFWLNRGVDGFRFDAVGNLVENGPGAWENQPENYTLMNGVRQLVGRLRAALHGLRRPGRPDRLPATACGSAFAFGHQGDVINAAKGNTRRHRRGGRATSRPRRPACPPCCPTTTASPASALWDQLGGNQAQYRLAAATYLLQPGTPFIYYGEEIGMAGAANLSGDPRLRTPMSWTDDAGKRRLHHRHAVPRALGQRRLEQRGRAARRLELAAELLQGASSRCAAPTRRWPPARTSARRPAARR